MVLIHFSSNAIRSFFYWSTPLSVSNLPPLHSSSHKLSFVIYFGLYTWLFQYPESHPVSPNEPTLEDTGAVPQNWGLEGIIAMGTVTFLHFRFHLYSLVEWIWRNACSPQWSLSLYWSSLETYKIDDDSNACYFLFAAFWIIFCLLIPVMHKTIVS